MRRHSGLTLLMAAAAVVMVTGARPASATATPAAASVHPADASRLAAAVDPAHAPGTYRPVQFWRALDTRTGTGAAKHPVAAAGTIDLLVTGHGGVPSSDVAAVAVNITATQAAAGGHITAFGTGSPRPGTSNLNYQRGLTQANLVVVPVGAGGAISLYNGSAGAVELIGDIEGYYLGGAPTVPGAFDALTPARLLDTRIGTGAPPHAIASSGEVTFMVSGQGGVPPSGVSAVVLGLTAVTPTAHGYLTAWADGTTRPTVSNLNFTAQQTIANVATVRLGADGRVRLHNGSSGSTQLLADVFGYYLDGTPTAVGAFVPMTPRRVLDTRVGIGTTGGTLGGHAAYNSQGGVPYSSLSAVQNLTATNGVRSGHLTAPAQLPAPHDPPTPTSTLNYAPGQTVANGVNVPIFSGVAVVENAGAGPVDVIADVFGYTIGPSTQTWSAAQDVGAGPLTDIDCPSTTFCVAVGTSNKAAVYNGSTWSVGGALFPGGSHTIAVSCASSSFCVAVTEDPAVSSYAVFDGTGWSAAAPVGGGVQAISCAAPNRCLAAGADAFTFDGSSWAAHPSPLAQVDALSCPTTTFCLAAGGAAAASATFNGTNWTTPQRIQTSLRVASVSCASPTYCLAAASNGTFEYAGTGWNVPVHDYLEDLDCVSESHCVGTTTTLDEVDVHTGATWTTFTQPGLDGPTAISCPDEHVCVTADSAGQSRIGTS